MGMMEEDDGPPLATTSSGRIKTSITLPRSLLRRIRRAAAIEKRTPSFYIEVVMEAHVREVEKAHGLSATTLQDDD
jgi:hypothetical protein